MSFDDGFQNLKERQTTIKKITRSTVRVTSQWRSAADHSRDGLFRFAKVLPHTYVPFRAAFRSTDRELASNVPSRWHCRLRYHQHERNATGREKELSPPNDCLCVNRRKLSAQNTFDTNFLRLRLWWQSWVRWLMTESLGHWIEMWNVRHIRTHNSRDNAGTSTDAKINIKYVNATRWQKLWRTALFNLQSWVFFYRKLVQLNILV